MSERERREQERKKQSEKHPSHKHVKQIFASTLVYGFLRKKLVYLPSFFFFFCQEPSIIIGHLLFYFGFVYFHFCFTGTSFFFCYSLLIILGHGLVNELFSTISILINARCIRPICFTNAMTLAILILFLSVFNWQLSFK